jgi:hypothetical protein
VSERVQPQPSARKHTLSVRRISQGGGAVANARDPQGDIHLNFLGLAQEEAEEVSLDLSPKARAMIGHHKNAQASRHNPSPTDTPCMHWVYFHRRGGFMDTPLCWLQDIPRIQHMGISQGKTGCKSQLEVLVNSIINDKRRNAVEARASARSSAASVDGQARPPPCESTEGHVHLPLRRTFAACPTPAVNEGCTRSLRISHTSRRAPLQHLLKTQVPCTPYHPPNIAGVLRYGVAHNLLALNIRHKYTYNACILQASVSISHAAGAILASPQPLVLRDCRRLGVHRRRRRLQEVAEGFDAR